MKNLNAVIGMLSCRAGDAVQGDLPKLRELLKSKQNLLFVGRYKEKEFNTFYFMSCIPIVVQNGVEVLDYSKINFEKPFVFMVDYESWAGPGYHLP